METLDLKIEGMTCGGCVQSVTRVLTSIAGVADAQVSLEEGSAHITYDPTQTGAPAMRQAVERAGYKAP